MAAVAELGSLGNHISMLAMGILITGPLFLLAGLVVLGVVLLILIAFAIGFIGIFSVASWFLVRRGRSARPTAHAQPAERRL